MAERETPLEDIANKFPDIYLKTSPSVLKEVWGMISKTRGECLNSLIDPVYLNIGPGRYVTPDAWKIDNTTLRGSNRDVISQEIRNGRILLMDCSIEGLNQSMKTLSQLGFFERGYFIANSLCYGKAPVNPRQLPPRSVTPIFRDLRDHLNIEEGTVDLTQISLCSHHTTPTHLRAVEVFRGIKIITRPRGKMILAEGDVDISGWTEKKTLEIAKDFGTIEGREVYIIDSRDRGNERTRVYLIDPRKHYDWFPHEFSCRDTSLIKMFSRIHLDGDGKVGLFGWYTAEELKERFERLDYTDIVIDNGKIEMPLRNLLNWNDRVNQIGILNYYDFISRRSSIVSPESVEAIKKEEMDALLGRVEFYMSKNHLRDALVEAGWKVLRINSYPTSPFYQLDATKKD
jgi:hypothetical protein